MSVMVLLNSNVLLEERAAGQAARQRRHEEMQGVEAYGAWRTEEMESLSLLASCLATSSNVVL